MDVDQLPDAVIQAVADAVSPAEIGEPDSPTSELVHRVMLVTYLATTATNPA